MITIGFRRFGNGILIPHVDVLRNLNRTFRRAEIDVQYSRGFIKHMRLKLTQPLPFGIADEDSYVSADAEPTDLRQVLYDFNENCPPFLQAFAVYRTEKNPNLAAEVNFAEYFSPCNLTKEQMEKINSLPVDYTVTQKKKEEVVTKSTEGLIRLASADENGVRLILAFGNVNLRVDLLLDAFNRDFGTSFELTRTVRTKQWIVSDRAKTAAEYLSEIATESAFLK